MGRPVSWGIPHTQGPREGSPVRQVNEAERRAIERRRLHYRLEKDKGHAVGLALSGGGIRSATFSLGVLIALAKRNILPQVDYLSTVSGGG
jgi:predicted acylesterase/phospholipase RssA